MIGGFFPLVARMKYVKRWSLMRNTNEENLMEHSYETAVLAQTLAIIANRVYNKSVDINTVAAAALYHDCSEIITGDMPTPVKYKNKDIRAAYKQVEKEAKERLCSMVPKELLKDFEELICFEERNKEEYRYIKAADKLSAYIKCIGERQGGNLDFLSAEKQLLTAVRELNMEEADYFLENFVPLYGETLDKLTKDNYF